MTRYAYPATIEPGEEDEGGFTAEFPDVPRAYTNADDEETLVRRMEDVLLMALGQIVERGEPLPNPSPAHGRPLVFVPPLEAAKLALYEAMRERNMRPADLARLCETTDASAARMLDLDHRTHIGTIHKALGRLGKRVVLEVRDAA